MGGLTVLASMRERLPEENFVYLGDTARLPYGTKSPLTVTKYALAAAQTLVARGVKALVVACNTASAFALPELQRQFAPLPVFGVVEPGAQAAAQSAVELMQQNEGARGVLVLATESTIVGGAYQRALMRLLPHHHPVFGRACPLWVTLAEQGPTDEQFVRTVLAHSLRGFLAAGPGTVLLGCTHFPVFRGMLEEMLERQRVGTGLGLAVQLVDSAATTAVWVHEQLSSLNLLRGGNRQGQVQYLATDGASRFKMVGSYFLGSSIDQVDLVDL